MDEKTRSRDNLFTYFTKQPKRVKVSFHEINSFITNARSVQIIHIYTYNCENIQLLSYIYLHILKNSKIRETVSSRLKRICTRISCVY